MSKDTKMGSNRTGLQTSPRDAKELVEAAANAMPTSDPFVDSAAALRASYVREAEAEGGLGSMPPPGTMKGMLKSGVDMMTGDRAHVLLDKMGERLAFERGGTRLYDIVLMKFDALSDNKGVSREVLQRIRDEEVEHFQLLSDAIEELGGDPTAQTPCADLVGVQSLGLMQSVSDPRTTLSQCLSTLLIAELTDTAGWEMLIELARESGHSGIADRFERAAREEVVHLQQVRAWCEALAKNEQSLIGTTPTPNLRTPAGHTPLGSA
jgi:rubrerythrin